MDELSLSNDDDDVLNYKSYFRIYKEGNKTYSECQIDNCTKKKLSGKQRYNLERHLRTIHKMANFNIVKEMPNKEVSLRLKMDSATIRRAWVESVALDGRIIGCMNDAGTRRLLNPLLHAFEKAGVKVDVSVPTLKEYLTKCAAEVKSEIRKEIENSIIHVKLDLARRQRKSILGVNIQYMKDDVIKVRTLSMLQTNGSHTGEYICSLLMQILDDFNIKYSQIHTITTDNGRNVLRSVDLFRAIENADLLDKSLEDIELHQLFGEEISTDDARTEETGSSEDTRSFEEMEITVNDAIQLLQAKTDIITPIKCAAHTVQLVVNVAMENTSYAKKLIKKCRRIVRSLLSPNMLNMIRQQNFKMPLMDCLTRWSSTYYMLERFVELKEFYQNVISFLPSNCHLNDADWAALDGVISVLKLFERLTKKLQAVEFTVSDFYAAWVELLIEMENLRGIELVDNILQQMETRERDFLRNDVVYSCVYLDARYQILLDAGKKLCSTCILYLIHSFTHFVLNSRAKTKGNPTFGCSLESKMQIDARHFGCKSSSNCD